MSMCIPTDQELCVNSVGLIKEVKSRRKTGQGIGEELGATGGLIKLKYV